MVDTQEDVGHNAFTSCRIAVHAHIFYIELWEELRKCIQNYIDVCGRDAVTVYVTFPASKQEIETVLQGDDIVSHLVGVGNYGYDVAPFFRILDEISLDDYDYIVKIHTKRDTPKCWVNFKSFQGGEWRKCLLSFCVTPSAVRTSIKALVRYPRLGMVAGRRLIDPSGVGSGRHPEFAEGVIADLGVTPKGRTMVYGTMFMVRAKLLKPAWRKVSQADFGAIIPGREHEEFGLAGKWECAFGMLVEAQGAYVSDGTRAEFPDRQLLLLLKLKLRVLRFMSDTVRSLVGGGVFSRLVALVR